MEAFRKLVLPVDRHVGHFGQRVEHFLLLPRLRRQDSEPAVVQDLEAGELEQIHVFVDDDLVHLRPLLDRGHAVVGGEDDVQAVAQIKARNGLPQVADGAVDLRDDLLPVGVVRSLGVAHVVRLAIVQRHEVEVFLGEPAQHLVDVLLPLGLVVVRVVKLLKKHSVDHLTAVVGAAAGEVEGRGFQTLNNNKQTVNNHKQTNPKQQP